MDTIVSASSGLLTWAMIYIYKLVNDKEAMALADTGSSMSLPAHWPSG